MSRSYAKSACADADVGETAYHDSIRELYFSCNPKKRQRFAIFSTGSEVKW